MTALAEVLIPPMAQAFSYTLPQDAESVKIAPGFQVTVPLGTRSTVGYVVKVLNGKDAEQAIAQSKFKLKNIQKVEEARKCFQESQMDFYSWVARYYGSTLSTVIDVAIPKSYKRKIRKIVTLLAAPSDASALRGKLQKELVDYLTRAGGTADYSLLIKSFKNSRGALKRLQELNVISVEEHDVVVSAGDRHVVPDWAKRSVNLNEQQLHAKQLMLEASSEERFDPMLLHGVTGSGKTEVYIEVIAELAAMGKGALVIVPEIALTPQLLDRFTARLGKNIALLHSGLSPRARWEAWEALLDGRCQIAVGARSAVFAPIKNLGAIIVDEEHDNSFKQSEGLRYHGRDCAVMRAKMAGCPLLLGSATPSLESYYNAQSGKYRLISLPVRHGVETAVEFQLVDCSQKRPWEMASPHVSIELQQSMDKALGDGGQVFILYNRRGFASYLQCPLCQEVLSCPNCNVTLTLHRNVHSLKCHYCGYSQVPPKWCPACESKEHPLKERGAGTERIIDELKELFPGVTLDRLDRDAVSSHDQYKKVLERVRSGETRILVGTQMIAKGHDLPEVTLVGIADCDVGLHMPDFRASERVYQLLTQAAGRTGRGAKDGKVILQTRVAKHPSLRFTLAQDYQGFAKHELSNRKLLRYPPYSRLLRIVAQANDNEEAKRALEEVFRRLKSLGTDVQLLGPTQAPLAKLKTRWRWHLLCKSSSLKDMHNLLYQAQATKHPKSVRMSFDLDPQDLL